MSEHRRRTARRRCTGGVLISLIAVGAPAIAVAQQGGGSTPVAFSGSTFGYGVQVSLTVPRFPLTDTLVDLSAPTTSAELDSLGAAVGFAAFPSPGELVLSAPGLVVGLASQGIAGLPPIELPSLPDYPLSARADSTNPTQTVGTGPYRLDAVANAEAARGSGHVGLQSDLLGRVAAVRSTSDVRTDGETASAATTSTIEGLSIGPLTLGEVRTTASAQLTRGQMPTFESDVEITGARIAGLAVTVGADGISIAGTDVALPIGKTLDGILSVLGIDIEFLPESQTGDTVTSGGLRISQPIDLTDVLGGGVGTGTLEIVLGRASATLKGATPAPVPVAPVGGVETASGSGDGVQPSFPTGLADLPLPLLGSPSLPVAPTVGPSSPPAAAPTQPDVELTGLAEDIDLRTLYLVGVITALATLALSTGIRFLGVRSP